MVTVELQNVILHAYHGIHEGEENVGSEYQVNLQVKFDEVNADFDSLEKTISYADLFDMLRQRMLVRVPLIEKAADGIIRHIKHQYPMTKEVILSIYKLQPPVENFQGKLGVTIHRIFDE